MTTYAHTAAVVDRLIAEARINPTDIYTVSIGGTEAPDVTILCGAAFPAFAYEARDPKYTHVLDADIEREDLLIRLTYIDWARKAA